MKMIKKFLKNNIKGITGFILGGVVIGGVSVYAAVAGSSISYNNTNSELSTTTVQGAIDEIYSNKSNRNIVAAYTPNSSTCPTGDESTCVKTTCYKTKNSRQLCSGNDNKIYGK